MNKIIASRIIELSENKPMFYKLRMIMKDYKMVIAVTIIAYTLKVAAEQLVMLFR